MAPYDGASTNPYGMSRNASQNNAMSPTGRQLDNNDLTRTFSQSNAPRGNPRSPPPTGERPAMNPYRQRQLERTANNQSSGSMGGYTSQRSASSSVDYGSESANPYARPRRQQDSVSQLKDITSTNTAANTAHVEDTNPFNPKSPRPNTNNDMGEVNAPQDEQGEDQTRAGGGERGNRRHQRMSTYGGRYAAGGGSGHEHTKSNSSQRSLRSSRNSSFSQSNRRRPGDDVEDENAYRELQREQVHPDGVFNELPVLSDTLRKFPELENDNVRRRRVDPDAFYSLSERLEQVVDTIVRTHHRSFTDTIDAYSSVLEAVTAAQKAASELKADMIECKDQMIRLLDEIEDLKKVPERVEQLRQKHEHTEAVAQVVKALDHVENGPLAGIGALADLKKQLLAERNTMHERLIEELLKLLYLKQSDKSRDDEDADTDDLFIDWHNETQTGSAARGPLARLTVLLSCLNELKKLPEALETVRQRMPAEVHQLIDCVIAKLEHECADPVELLHALQSRLLRVIEIHRQIYIKAAEFQMTDTDAAIVTELGLSSYKESWMTVQNELKSFFYDYLSEDQRNVDPHTTPAASINEALRGKRKLRDQPKKLFRLLDTDAEVDFADAYDTVQQRITMTFPDFRGEKDNDDADGGHTGTSHTTDASIAMAAGLLSGEKALGRHILLAKPSPAVAARLFRPVLEFLERARRVDR
ncbi:hypothetical protein BDF19DRAFT_447899 [Syncephalis fuscata]|nr:hypothetical protein BDF19DRAFT_447899 [Syncephalis fuscata]